jgi:SAM-dependent methyltransferase
MNTPINAFFKWDDRKTQTLAGYRLDDAWWSRHYEYPWALQFAEPSQVVADMGCGWMYRPFKEALAEICGHVYAIDADRRLLQQAQGDNLELIVADFSRHVDLPDKHLDIIFCISVLEDLNDFINGAVAEFARLLKDDGLIVATFDVHYDETKPLGRYPGVNFEKLERAMHAAGLEFAGDVDMDKTNAVFNIGFNLACFHAVMRKK